MHRDRLSYILIPLAALVAILPLLINGCSCGHDFDFHLLNWMEAARQFTHGNLHPHWAFSPAYNAGEPRFVFYPPLSWTMGAILGLIFPWQWTPILYTWLALSAAGLSLNYLARDFTNSKAALIAAIVYTVNPYMLFTAYERTAYAELLAAAFIPLLLHAILSSKITIPRIAIPVALLWLTNAPAAVMSCYALALLTVIRLATNSSSRFIPVASNNRSATNPGAPYLDSEMWVSRESANAQTHSNTSPPQSQTPLQLAINAAAGTILGLTLAAFYILPAAYERRFVQIAMAIIPFYRIHDNFLFHHTDDAAHDQVLHTASLIAIALITLTALALTYLAATNKSTPSTNSGTPSSTHLLRLTWASSESATASPKRPLLYALAVLTIAIALLLTPLTAFIWNHAPELAFLQFPWRLLAILAAVFALTLALVLKPIQLTPLSTAAFAAVIVAALIYPAYTVFHQTCDPSDTVQARLAVFYSNQGTDPTDEYTPTTADNDSLAQTNPSFWISSDPNGKAPINARPGPAPTHFSFKAAQPGYLILNLRDYPSWDITSTDSNSLSLDHPRHIHRDDGLVALPIYAADYKINITYMQTLDQTLGDFISVISLALLSVFALRKTRP